MNWKGMGQWKAQAKRTRPELSACDLD